MKHTMTRKTAVETGAYNSNHNETRASGLRVCTAVKAGAGPSVSEIVVTKDLDCSSCS